MPIIIYMSVWRALSATFALSFLLKNNIWWSVEEYSFSYFRNVLNIAPFPASFIKSHQPTLGQRNHINCQENDVATSKSWKSEQKRKADNVALQVFLLFKQKHIVHTLLEYIAKVWCFHTIIKSNPSSLSACLSTCPSLLSLWICAHFFAKLSASTWRLFSLALLPKKSLTCVACDATPDKWVGKRQGGIWEKAIAFCSPKTRRHYPQTNKAWNYCAQCFYSHLICTVAGARVSSSNLLICFICHLLTILISVVPIKNPVATWGVSCKTPTTNNN